MIRKLKREDLKKLDSKYHTNSSLRPFGVPISQSDYTKQKKLKKNNTDKKKN